jgi:hypothetical protein
MVSDAHFDSTIGAKNNTAKANIQANLRIHGLR